MQSKLQPITIDCIKLKVSSFQGTLIHDYITTYRKDCLTKCIDDSTCTWFSYSKQRNLCLLFSDCESELATDPSFVSGQTGCTNPPASKFYYLPKNLLLNA